QLLERLGLTVEAHEVPRAAVEAVGMKSVTNLIIRHRFGDGPVIALNAHGDVVPPGLGWRFHPYGAVIEGVFRIDRPVIPEGNPAEIDPQWRGLIAAWAGRNPQIKAAVRQLLLAEPLTPQSGADRIVAAIQRRAKQILGVDVPMTGVPLYTDARHYSAAGIPIVLYGAGPRSIREANAHDANENLRLDDLRAATKIVAMAVADLLGTR